MIDKLDKKAILALITFLSICALCTVLVPGPFILDAYWKYVDVSVH